MTTRRAYDNNDILRPDFEADGEDDTEAAGSNNASLVRALDRGLHILRCFDANHPEWTLSDLSRESGLHKATAHRFIKTLEARGFISLNQATGKYALGPAVFQMAYVWIAEAELGRMAAQYVEELTALTGESAGLTVWNGDGALCVAHAPSPRPFRYSLTIGQSFTDHANAHSKVLLAFGPESRRARVLSRRLERLTPYTIVDPDRYADELRRVADEGVAYDMQEQKLGVCGLAVPVRDYSGEVRASLSIPVPEERFGPAEVKKYIQALIAVADSLSYDLGYRGSRSFPLAKPSSSVSDAPRE